VTSTDNAGSTLHVRATRQEGDAFRVLAGIEEVRAGTRSWRFYAKCHRDHPRTPEAPSWTGPGRLTCELADKDLDAHRRHDHPLFERPVGPFVVAVDDALCIVLRTRDGQVHTITNVDSLKAALDDARSFRDVLEAEAGRPT
jgi:hypothetical protein